MTNYILRHVDAKLWKQAKRRAESDGHTLRWVIIRLLELYVAGLSVADIRGVEQESAGRR